MPKTHDTGLGAIIMVPPQALYDTEYGLSRLDKNSRDCGAWIPPAHWPPDVLHWPRVGHAVLREGEFIIEADCPDYSANLSFSPAAPEAGRYLIRRRPRGIIETGYTRTVESVTCNSGDYHLQKLRIFEHRFTVITRSAERPFTNLLWLVGLHHVPKASANSLDEGI